MRAAEEREKVRGQGPRRIDEEVWIFEGVVDEDEDAGAGPRAGTKRRQPERPRSDRPTGRDQGVELPPGVVDEITRGVEPRQAGRVAERLAAAAGAYERDRYRDALRMTKTVLELAPRSATALELYGLASYRIGHWRDALRYLGQAAEVAGRDESQIPVLMDCHRALRHRHKVRALWDELRASSPAPDVLVEGRLVLAATLRDEGKLDEAIAELVDAGAARMLRHPGDRHIRQWYLLADLYERAGDMPRARELFARVAEADPELADASARLAAIGKGARGSDAARRRGPGPRTAPRAEGKAPAPGKRAAGR